MRWMIYTHVPWPEWKEPAQVYEETAEHIRYGEELGFHSAWLAEHHFSRYGLASSQLMLATKIAAQTKSIRFGTAVLVPPLHHPIQLAEEIAMFDQLSGGRLDIGFGRGSANYEYRDYNVDQEESRARFQKTIQIVTGLLTTPDFSYRGRFCQMEHVNLVPPPLQKPCPPIHIAATRTPETLQFVAASGVQSSSSSCSTSRTRWSFAADSSRWRRKLVTRSRCPASPFSATSTSPRARRRLFATRGRAWSEPST